MKQPGIPKKINGRATLDLDTHVPSLLNWVASKLGNGASQEFREKFNVGITEWRVMSLLAIEPNITANRIAEVIGLNKGALSRSLHSLASRGLVTIRPSDRDSRSHVNALTAAGEELHDCILPVALERERRLLSVLSPKEIDDLIRILNRLHDVLPYVNSSRNELP